MLPHATQLGGSVVPRERNVVGDRLATPVAAPPNSSRGPGDRRVGPAAETAPGPPGPGVASQRGDDERDECLGDVLRVSVQIFHQGADHERLIWWAGKRGWNLLSKWMGTGVNSIISQYIPVFFGHFSGIVYIYIYPWDECPCQTFRRHSVAPGVSDCHWPHCAEFHQDL